MKYDIKILKDADIPRLEKKIKELDWKDINHPVQLL